MTAQRPLVTVCVVAYRSAPFVLETLDSIAAQTYSSLELIVGDDCSPDDTAALCREWIDAHGNRFVRTQLITVAQNTGVSANANRAFAAARGEWIKIIAADDRLLPTCIADNVDFVTQHPDKDIVFSNMQEFGDVAQPGRVADYTRYFTRLSAREFRLWQTVYSALPAPSSFIRRTTWQRLGGFDESIAFMEDKPFWLKALAASVPMACFATPTVAYRIHGASIMQTRQTAVRVNARRRESDLRAARLFLGAMRRESLLLWLYGKALYAKDLGLGEGPDQGLWASAAARLLYWLRLINPYYYYFKRLKRRLG